jgi:putative ABC transport system permease protein
VRGPGHGPARGPGLARVRGAARTLGAGARDLRFAARMLRRYPGHTAASWIALGLGLGLTTATFSIVDSLVLRGLPFPEPERLVVLGYESPVRGLRGAPVDPHDFVEWARRQHSFEGLAAFDIGTVTLTAKGVAERLNGGGLSADSLRVLRVGPALGRGFAPRDEAPGAPPVALLGWRVWKDRFDGDPAIVGRAIRLDGQPATVVGVMPEGFLFPREEEVWTPVTLDLAGKSRGQADPELVVGRLRRGVSLGQARADLSAIAGALAQEFPKTNAGLGAAVEPYAERFLGQRVKVALFAMLGAVLSVLLLACINVAGLGMARAAQRTREIAIRSALGAGRGRVVAQMLIESGLLAGGGAALGLALARLGMGIFNRVIVEQNPPFWWRALLDPAALGFALAATVAAALLAGLGPAVDAARTDLDRALRDEGRGSTSRRLGRFSRGVVVAELALSCALLVAAGLMVKSAVKAQTAPLGFEPRGLLTFRVAVFPEKLPRPADRAAFYGKLLDRLAARPGVRAVGGATTLPAAYNGLDGPVPYALEGHVYARDADHPLAHSAVVTPGFFAVLGAPLLAGREFGRLDGPSAQPVAIVNRSLARLAWPGQDPLGQRLRRVPAAAGEGWRTVVGVVPDLEMDGLRDLRPAGFYVPLAQSGPARMSFAVRTAGPPLALVPAARAETAALDRDTPIYFVQTMDQVVHGGRFESDLFAGLFSIFGVAALLLGAIGIYGVIALSVGRRRQEIGVRLALGAGRGRVMAMLLREGAVQLGWGLALGLPAAWGLSRLLGGLLFRVEPGDPAVFSLVALTLAAVAAVATVVPGRRAMRVDPAVAVRYD